MAAPLDVADITEMVKKAAAEVSADLSGATADTRLDSLGMDSLTRVEMVGRLEEYLSLRIPDDILPQIETVGDLVTAVQRLRDAGPSPIA